jgi:molecular chaperone GrpE
MSDKEKSEASGEVQPDEQRASEEGAPEGAAVAGEGAEPTAEDRLAALEREKDDYYDRLLRATADLDNLRKRSRREVEDARRDGRSRALKEILPVVDNLERAVQHAGSASGDTQGVVEGVQLVLRQFSQALERLGVQSLEAEGKPFDPNVHEAMSQMESAELPPGSVAQVLQRGYMIDDRLLRPALVIVSKAPAGAAETGNGEMPEPNGGGSGDMRQED